MIKTALLAILSTTMVACAGPGYAYYEASYDRPVSLRYHRPVYVPERNYYFSPCSPRPFTPPNPWIPGGAGGYSTPVYRTYSGVRIAAEPMH